MSAIAAPSVAATRILVERRFPLSLSRSIGTIRELYETAKAGHWDPNRQLSWSEFDASAYPLAVREAARRIWSRRAWLEYTGLSETPALLIRFCLEAGRESDPKLFLSVRNTEEAWHVECFHRLTELLGGYLDRPEEKAWEQVFDQGLYRLALDADQPLDEYVAVHCAFEDGLELALYEAYFDNAKDTLVSQMLQKVVADKRRHASFGWLYLESRVAQLDSRAGEAIVTRIGAWTRDVALAGYHVPSLSRVIDSSTLDESARLVAEAGLGAVDSDSECRVFVEFYARARERLAGYGLQLPSFDHPRLGSF